MAATLLNVRLTDQARTKLSFLPAEERRRIEAWFQHLGNWWNDEHLRSISRRIDGEEKAYMLRTSLGLYIAFRLEDDSVTVLSILSEESVRAFEAAASSSAQ